MERLRESSGQTPDATLSPGGESQAETVFQQGLRHQKQNRLDLAAACYKKVLDQVPNHAGAWHFLGVISLIQKNHPLAREQIEQALAFCDTNPVYFNNYGVVLKTAACLREAKTAFEKAITLHPDYADAWSNFGQILLEAIWK